LLVPKQVDDFDDLEGEYARGGPGTRRVRYRFDQRPTSRRAGCLALPIPVILLAAVLATIRGVKAARSSLTT
jgi:hypothetical protein